MRTSRCVCVCVSELIEVKCEAMPETELKEIVNRPTEGVRGVDNELWVEMSDITNRKRTRRATKGRTKRTLICRLNANSRDGSDEHTTTKCKNKTANEEWWRTLTNAGDRRSLLIAGDGKKVKYKKEKEKEE